MNKFGNPQKRELHPNSELLTRAYILFHLPPMTVESVWVGRTVVDHITSAAEGENGNASLQLNQYTYITYTSTNLNTKLHNNISTHHKYVLCCDSVIRLQTARRGFTLFCQLPVCASLKLHINLYVLFTCILLLLSTRKHLSLTLLNVNTPL